MTLVLPVDRVVFFSAALLVIGILVVSDRLRVPAALPSLGLGMLVGSDGLGLIDVGDDGLVRNLSIVALVFILFEGGLTTKPSALREAEPPSFLLSKVGVVITARSPRSESSWSSVWDGRRTCWWARRRLDRRRGCVRPRPPGPTSQA